MGDLSETGLQLGWTLSHSIFFSGLLLGLIASAILYGCLLYEGISGTATLARLRALQLSFGLAVAFLILSTVVEVYLGRLEAYE